MVLAHHCWVECLGFRATHCLEWLWSRLTRASRCGPRASASSGLTAGGKCALSTWKLSIVDRCIHSIIRLYQKSPWHACRATTSLTDRKICPDCRSVLSYANRLHVRQASQGPSWLQTITETDQLPTCTPADIILSYLSELE